ncbi:transcription antitermination factor NusB [Candidatus Margulisiibacteriota bacterium]
MGKRNTGRKLAMQILYQTDIQTKTIEEVIKNFFATFNYEEKTKEWAIFLAQNAWQKRKSADEIIKKYSIGWDLKRINKIDKNLLRLALYELQYCETPVNVVLNEVIDIAKKYSTEDSPKFINGILGKFVEKECLQV